MKCSFCDRDASLVSCLVAGPAGNNICRECADTIFTGMAHHVTTLKQPVLCTFCGVADTQPHGIGSNGDAKICTQCIAIARASSNQANHNLR